MNGVLLPLLRQREESKSCRSKKQQVKDRYRSADVRPQQRTERSGIPRFRGGQASVVGNMSFSMTDCAFGKMIAV